MKRTKKLSRTEIRQTIDRAWRDTIKDCFGVTPSEALKLLQPYQRNTETPMKGLTLAMVFGLGGYGKHLAKKFKINTDQDLQKAVELIRNMKHEVPSATRKALKMIASKLPRGGGPGRQPKMNRQEASKACDQIGMFIRQGHDVKKSLLLMAESSPAILGKKVGARTLQKAWDIRAQLADE